MASKCRANNFKAEDLLVMEMTSAKSGLLSKQSAKRDSTTTETRKSGNSSLSARTGLVSSRQSPIERSRIRRMRAFCGSLRNRSLVFNRRFADQHDGNVIAYRIHAMACRALQSLSAVGELNGRLAQRTNKNLQQFRIHCHSEQMLARRIRICGMRNDPAIDHGSYFRD